jgi:hypothetical protein
MATIHLRLDPRKLENADLDIRYALPDLLALKSNGLISDDGYDYVGNVPFLVLFLKTDDVDRSVELILKTLNSEQVLGNDLLDAVVVAVERDDTKVIVHPMNFVVAFDE